MRSAESTAKILMESDFSPNSTPFLASIGGSASGVATGEGRGGGQAGHPGRLVQIRGDFHVGKNGVCRVCSHVLHAPTLWLTFFGLTITKKEEVVDIVQGVAMVGTSGSRGRGHRGHGLP